MDQALLEEIELLSDLIAAVADARSRSRLTVGEVDSLLGVSAGATGCPAACADHEQSAAPVGRLTAGSRRDDTAGQASGR